MGKKTANTQATDTHTLTTHTLTTHAHTHTQTTLSGNSHTLLCTPTPSRICKLTAVCRRRENKNGAAAAGSAAAATLTAGLDGSANLFFLIFEFRSKLAKRGKKLQVKAQKQKQPQAKEAGRQGMEGGRRELVSQKIHQYTAHTYIHIHSHTHTQTVPSKQQVNQSHK